MIYLAVAIVLAIVALLVLLLSLRLLIGTSLLNWLRGTVGFVVLTGAVIVALAAWDLHVYRQLDAKPIATLAFNKLDDKRYSLALVDQTGAEQRYEVAGDMWQLDVRILKWPAAAARIGVKPGYQLDRLSGRYLSLEDEQKQPHTVIALRSHNAWLDLWSCLQRVNRYFSLLTADYLSAAYQPMTDGALYSVVLVGDKVVAQPLNDRAKAAIAHWE